MITGLRYWHDQRNGAYHSDEPSNDMHIAFDHTQVVGMAFGAPFDESVVPITLAPDDSRWSVAAFVDNLAIWCRIQLAEPVRA